MKLRKLIKITFFILLISENAFPLDTISVKYFPLRVGNYWVYNHYWAWSGNTRFWVRVIDTLITNGHKYYKVRALNYPPGFGIYDEFIRVDSTQGNVRVYVTSYPCPWLVNERARDSLSAHTGDSSRFECAGYFLCRDTSIYLFGLNRPMKIFNAWGFESGEMRTFVHYIGMNAYYHYGPAGTSYQIDIRGCVINGVLYGDTSLTGINPISNEIPSDFKLYQNYPNPFNPITKIKFDVPSNLTQSEAKGLVQLIIYDILGREAVALVNENLKPGQYEVEWDATNYPSGVYYYKLVAGDFTVTKKTVLLR